MADSKSDHGLFGEDGPAPLDRRGIREGLVSIAERLGQSYHLAALLTSDRDSPQAERLLNLIFEGIRDVERLASRVPDENPGPGPRTSGAFRAIRAFVTRTKREGEEARRRTPD